MTHEEERRALLEKAEELSRVIDETETRLANAPQNEAMAPMRETMAKLVVELRSMEKNLRVMIQTGYTQETEGGTENGSY